MATFDNRDGKWRAKVRRKGFPSEGATFDTKAEARAWAAKLESEIVGRRHGKIIERTVAQRLERCRLEVAPTLAGSRWEPDTPAAVIERLVHCLLRAKAAPVVNTSNAPVDREAAVSGDPLERCGRTACSADAA